MARSNGQPLCITVFSAPNYCGSYGNRAAVFCTSADREGEDVITFEEDESKPVVLRMNEQGLENVDAISFYMDKLIGHVN